MSLPVLLPIRHTKTLTYEYCRSYCKDCDNKESRVWDKCLHKNALLVRE